MKLKSLFPLLFILACTTFGAAPAWSADTVRIYVLPFAIHSDSDLTFMRAGISDMLVARLTHPGKAEVISAPVSGIRATPSEALKAAREQGAHYMVLGSLTVFGDAVSTDARLIRVENSEEITVFHEAGSQKGDAILQADRFASLINSTLFGMKAPKSPPSAPQPKAEPNLAAPTPAPKATAQPEKTPTTKEKAALPKTPLLSRVDPLQGKSGIWKSRTIPSTIAGMSVGDVDGDGAMDIVLIDNRKVEIFKYGPKGLTALASFDHGVENTLLAVDTADLNNNKRAEIFLSAINSANSPSSFILEWDGFTVKPILENAPWHIRILQHPETGPMLVGQRQAKPSQDSLDKIVSNDVFLGRVTPLVVNGDELLETTGYKFPDQVNVYGLALGDAMNNGTVQTVSFADNDHIRLFGPDGNAVWTSNTVYGGGMSFIEIPTASAQKEMRKGERRYLPMRLWVGDFNGDGVNELAAPLNKDVGRRLFSRFRVFQSGQIQLLSWNDLTFLPFMQTDEVSGYIADFQVADITGDGAMELVFVVSQGIAGVFGKAESYVVVGGGVR